MDSNQLQSWSEATIQASSQIVFDRDLGLGAVPANQVIVMLKEGKGRTDADRLASSLGGQVVGFFDYINLRQIETSGTTDAELKDTVAKAKLDGAKISDNLKSDIEALSVPVGR